MPLSAACSSRLLDLLLTLLIARNLKPASVPGPSDRECRNAVADAGLVGLSDLLVAQCHHSRVGLQGVQVVAH